MNKIPFIFFGSSRFSVLVLEELEKDGLIPVCVVTTPDKPKGRGLALTPTPVKDWALRKKISLLDPDKLDASFIEKLKIVNCELYVVASYGKIIPEAIINIPPHGTLNIHPSLLPKYRGASPLQSAMLDDTKKTGITIMKIDKEMDHGPIVAQRDVTIDEWPPYGEFEEMMAREGARLLSETMPDWVAGKIEAAEQDYSKATYTKKVNKEDALLDLSGDAYDNFRKIQAYSEWPVAHFIIEHNGKKIRVKIRSASFKSGNLIIEKVIPEGGKEMAYEDFLRGYGNAGKQ
jgi:methionyl-tRNA formyltransferase